MGNRLKAKSPFLVFLGGLFSAWLCFVLVKLVPYPPLYYTLLGAGILFLGWTSSSSSSDTTALRAFTFFSVGAALYAAFGGERRAAVAQAWFVFTGAWVGAALAWSAPWHRFKK